MRAFAAIFILGAAISSTSAQTLYVPNGINGIGSSNQNIGVGTSNPDELLSIGLLGSAANLKIGSWAFLGHESSHYTTVLGGNVKASGSQSVVAHSTVDGYRAIRMRYDEGITFHTYLGPVATNDAVAHERMRIDVSGRVGIGTASPTVKLDVAGEILAWDSIAVRNASAEGGRLRIQNTNKSGATTSDWSLWNMTGGYGNGLAFWRYYADGTNAGPSLWLADNGRIGVGTTSPNSQLTVHGALVDFGNAGFSGTGSGNGIVLNANAQGVGIASVGVGFGGNGIAHGNLLWKPNEKQFVFGTGNYPTDLSNPYGHAGLAVMGSVGVGTTNTGNYKLAVNGTGKFKELIVETTGWSDYVFAPDYELQSLGDVEAHIKEHRHLPGIPSASEVAEHGVSIGEMQAKLLAKIEELTLHQIAQAKQLHAQQAEIASLKAQLSARTAAP